MSEIEQRTAEWFAERAGKFTASRMADLMAKTKSGPSASRARLITQLAVERITGTCVEGYSNAAMKRGIELEPEARNAYALHRNVIVDEVAFIRHPTIEMVGCSPDGLIDDDGMVEVKVPDSMAVHYDALLTGSHAVDYKWQLQTQLWVTERKWVDAVSFDPRFPKGLRLAIKRVERNSAMIIELAGEVAKAEAEIKDAIGQLLKLQEQAA